jgi:hypothetical protein
MHRARPQRSGGVPWHLHARADDRRDKADEKGGVGVVGWRKRVLTVKPLGRSRGLSALPLALHPKNDQVEGTNAASFYNGKAHGNATRRRRE